MDTASLGGLLKGLILAIAGIFVLWSMSDASAIVLEWLKVLSPLFLGAAVFVATVWFQNWQLRLAKQKLRHDLYERRFAIYVAFKDLLIALPEKGDDEIKVLLRRAEVASFEARFVLGEANIQAYLEELCKQVRDDVLGYITYLDAMNGQVAAIKNDPLVVKDREGRGERYAAAKHNLPARYLIELPQRFEEFMRLTDFLK
jgi:hypothetical protein